MQFQALGCFIERAVMGEESGLLCNRCEMFRKPILACFSSFQNERLLVYHFSFDPDICNNTIITGNHIRLLNPMM